MSYTDTAPDMLRIGLQDLLQYFTSERLRLRDGQLSDSSSASGEGLMPNEASRRALNELRRDDLRAFESFEDFADFVDSV